jgi:hypothetical protein
VRHSSRQRFPVKYTVKDLELLIQMDRAHQQLSGPAARRIVERERQVFGKREYAKISYRVSSVEARYRRSALLCVLGGLGEKLLFQSVDNPCNPIFDIKITLKLINKPNGLSASRR